jgi:hypothetical protein
MVLTSFLYGFESVEHATEVIDLKVAPAQLEHSSGLLSQQSQPATQRLINHCNRLFFVEL